MKKLIKLFAIALYFMPTMSMAEVDCNTHKLYCKILKFNPKLDPDYALTISNKIYQKSKAAGVDPNVSLAILMQESSLINQNTFKVHQDVEKKCDHKSCVKIIKETSHVVDMTLAQININTAVQYGFDIERLFFLDIDYALDCHYIVLKDKLKMCEHLGDKAWSCYHSITEEHRLKYVEMVSRFL